MRARLVAFPIQGKNWCFSRSIDQSVSESTATNTLSTVKVLWKKISSSSKPLNANTELLVDFISKRLGLRLLVQVKPSEILLKSITKEVTNVKITYPSSLNAQLVRRRLRQIALSEKLLQLVSNYSQVQNSMVSNGKGNESEHNDSKHRTKDSAGFQWVMEPSKELEDLLHRGHDNGSLSEHAFSDICMTFSLNKNDVLKCLMNTILSGMRERKDSVHSFE